MKRSGVSLSSVVVGSLLGAYVAVGAGCGFDNEAAGEGVVDQEVAAKVLRAEKPIPGEYIVAFHSNELSVRGQSAAAVSKELAAAVGAQMIHSYDTGFVGFAAKLPDAALKVLANDPRVAYIEENGEVSLSTTQTGATWGIDRIDQRNRPLSGTYTYTATGAGVHAYIIDTGIRRTHTQFTGRMSTGYDAVTAGGTGNDCNGHGTHVAGTVAGTTYGVAKGATLHPVRVLDCAGSGSYAGVIAGINWVTTNRIRPAVANMSLGGGFSQAVNDAVTASINAGVSYAVAAGNSNGANSCNYSPSSTPAAITVGSTTSTDAVSSFSNQGSCVDLFAPGSSILSAWWTSDTAANTISGTSMATPHVAGVAALLLQASPSATPATIASQLVTLSTKNALTGVVSPAPNRLLYSNVYASQVCTAGYKTCSSCWTVGGNSAEDCIVQCNILGTGWVEVENCGWAQNFPYSSSCLDSQPEPRCEWN